MPEQIAKTSIAFKNTHLTSALKRKNLLAMAINDCAITGSGTNLK